MDSISCKRLTRLSTPFAPARGVPVHHRAQVAKANDILPESVRVRRENSSSRTARGYTRFVKNQRPCQRSQREKERERERAGNNRRAMESAVIVLPCRSGSAGMEVARRTIAENQVALCAAKLLHERKNSRGKKRLLLLARRRRPNREMIAG